MNFGGVFFFNLIVKNREFFYERGAMIESLSIRFSIWFTRKKLKNFLRKRSNSAKNEHSIMIIIGCEIKCAYCDVVPGRGFEPPHPFGTQGPKPCASTVPPPRQK